MNKIKDIYVYSDESGTFDYVHNRFFLFGGALFFSKEEKDIASRKYSHVEKVIRSSGNFKLEKELKACYLSNKNKGKLYRSLNGVYKFCVIIDQKNINHKIFENKKHKQRYLDYAYKIVLRKCFELLIQKEHIHRRNIRFVIVKADEHSTATNGKYELRESLLNEFKNGTFNPTWEKHFEPIFPRLSDVRVDFCDSKTNYLIRAADIIANHCYYQVNKNSGDLDEESNMFIYYLPANYVGHDGVEYFCSSQSEVI